MFPFEKCAHCTLAVSVPASVARPSVGLGHALTAQGSRSLPSTPRVVPGQSLGVRTLRCWLYGVLLYFVSFFGPGSSVSGVGALCGRATVVWPVVWCQRANLTPQHHQWFFDAAR
jgi:hypothetical protein